MLFFRQIKTTFMHSIMYSSNNCNDFTVRFIFYIKISVSSKAISQKEITSQTD